MMGRESENFEVLFKIRFSSFGGSQRKNRFMSKFVYRRETKISRNNKKNNPFHEVVVGHGIPSLKIINQLDEIKWGFYLSNR